MIRVKRISKLTSRILMLLLVVGATWLVVGCGGGSSGGTPPPPGPVTVTISPSTASVAFGATQQFAATVTNTTNTAVTWSLSAQVGSISSSGLYTAPAAPPLPPPLASARTVSVVAGKVASGVNIDASPMSSSSTVTVTATSVADTTKTASATLTVTPLSLIALGTCDNSGNCSAGAGGVLVNPGQSTTLFVVGEAVAPGTSYSVSGNDVTVTQPGSSDFCSTAGSSPLPCVTVSIAVSSSAALGSRNLMVTNSNGELSVFSGAILITH
jgi:hypothetical protein